MSVFNGRAFLHESVESILSQTFQDYEFVVVDDGSTDGSSEILARYTDPRLRVIRNPSNLGLTRSLNVGLEASKGDLVARQDADDRSYPERLARQVAFLDANPSVALVGTQARGIDRSGSPVDLSGWPKATAAMAIRWQLMFDSPFTHTSVMFRRAPVSELGGYNEDFRTSQDFELFSRLAVAHELRNLRDVLVEWRVMKGSVSTAYSETDLRRVQAVLAENRKRWLDADEISAEALTTWGNINYAGKLGGVTDLRSLISSDDGMFRRFVALNPAAADDHEIRHYRAECLARGAGIGARRGIPYAGRLFARACRIEPAILVSRGPRFAACLLLGIAARARRTT
jgi:glycosyltransferase involved in cell wall biosynthesis